MGRKMITLCLLLWVVAGNAQISKTRINGYGHIDFTYEQENGASDAFMNIGEHDLFITSTFTKNISFLSEMVVKPSSGSSLGFVPALERARIKFRYFKNHSIIVGRMHLRSAIGMTFTIMAEYFPNDRSTLGLFLFYSNSCGRPAAAGTKFRQVEFWL